MTFPDINEHANFDKGRESLSKLGEVVYRIIQHKVFL